MNNNEQSAKSKPKHRQIIEAVLQKHLPDVEVWAYGSRANGKSHDGSDLDLVLRAKDLGKIIPAQIRQDTRRYYESTVPFVVEVRDWALLPESFHREIKREHVVLVK